MNECQTNISETPAHFDDWSESIVRVKSKSLRKADRCDSIYRRFAFIADWVFERSKYSRAQITANETAAIQVLRNISDAQTIYFDSRSRRSFATLEQLADDELIPSDLAVGERNGYRFAVRIVEGSESGSPAYEAIATPLSSGSTGKRSFYVNDDGVIRHADKNGAEATAKDPALN